MIEAEARILGGRLCLNPAIVQRWMEVNAISSILDLKTRYPKKSHAKAMEMAADEIWQFGMSSN